MFSVVTVGQTFSTGALDLGAHFPIVDADAAFFVELRPSGRAVVIGEETVDLLDAALVEALARLHHFVEDRNVERHHRDGGAGLGDEGLVDGDDRGLCRRSGRSWPLAVSSR